MGLIGSDTIPHEPEESGARVVNTDIFYIS